MAVFLLLLPLEFFTMEIKERPDDGHQHVHGHPKLQANVVCKMHFFSGDDLPNLRQLLKGSGTQRC